jgi:DNA-binding response OmpR family regulator
MMQMPVMDGFEATRLLRQSSFSGHIIGLTGNALDDQVSQFLSMGVDEVIAKPIKRNRIEALLRQYGIIVETPGTNPNPNPNHLSVSSVDLSLLPRTPEVSNRFLTPIKLLSPAKQKISPEKRETTKKSTSRAASNISDSTLAEMVSQRTHSAHDVSRESTIEEIELAMMTSGQVPPPPDLEYSIV